MRYLALDLGDRRIGVAISDALGIVARPLEVFERGARVADFAHIASLAANHHAGTIVVGLPLNMDGTRGQQATWVEDYTACLASAVTIPVILWDERLSTEEAAEALRAQGKAPTRDWIDAVAAAVILQGYLDAHTKGT